MRLHELVYPVESFVGAAVPLLCDLFIPYSMSGPTPPIVMVNGWVSQPESVDTVPSALDIAHQLDAVTSFIREMRKTLRDHELNVFNA